MKVPGHPLIEVRKGVCGGRPLVRGTRMRVTDILGALAAGDREEEILADFDDLTVEDIRACLAYAAAELSQPVELAA